MRDTNFTNSLEGRAKPQMTQMVTDTERRPINGSEDHHETHEIHERNFRIGAALFTHFVCFVFFVVDQFCSVQSVVNSGRLP